MRIAKSEFARRRKALMDVMEPDSIAIVPAAPERTRSRDTEYIYRQDSDFFYLTGFAEPEAVLVLIPEREHGEFVLFCRDRDPEREIWDGYRAGPNGACEQFGADDAFPIDDIDDILPGLLEGRERVYYAMGKDAGFDRQVMEWVNTIRAKVRSGATPPGEFLDLAHFLHDNRLYKSAGEIRVMREASEISARAHVRAMQYCQPGVMEYQLEAEILHEFAMAGARSPAYNSIVGGGKNGCILHYVENSAALKAGDLVLIDAGCELDGYAADITRTFPVSGSFSEEQKALYEIVLAAQESALTTVKPGAHWNEPHEASVRTITEGLLGLGLLAGELETLIEDGAYRRFYMHRIGHWLGMDVHDVGDYKVGGEWRVLEPGMVMTVEPGIYVSPDDETVAKKWRGIGIRIEDDVLVTKDGYDILSKDVPKTVSEIEAVMASAQTHRSA
ncbi:Xaa-Pro aminopeptidase [Gilvimarinus sp. SDUM040013]|uniref:Xaa-Pro aminopeptidase n=1 Tax=Gilvimarinus gilvus TaxID=3058038 RepID=A0ABU4RUL7_9GAMM|nr:Xaa-Pro aminopeptidase [Gilvimarinus sp. SDUM040013]MDO3388568.1 Xaa-Pro aminopeptidase [Gilvimarinus sp. SDUM040013]MDX6848560.1 Xaa-Pro aminopeptidase [Gilvimarinus sp. SDUM040013]